MFKKPAMNDALLLLAQGVPVAIVAEQIQRNKHTIYRWLKIPKFAEALRVEIQRAMSGTRRELGQLARRAIASAAKSMDQLEHTRDDPNATPAARERAANRLLQHAFKWGQVIDKELESGEASGARDGSQPVDFARESETLTYYLHRSVQILRMLEKAAQKSGVKIPENIAGMVKWIGLERFNNYLDQEDAAQSELFKQSPDEIPEKKSTDRDPKDDARRARYRQSELAGTPKPQDIDEKGEEIKPKAPSLDKHSNTQ
jgi:hypothetical protein